MNSPAELLLLPCIKIYNVLPPFQDEKWWLQFFTCFPSLVQCLQWTHSVEFYCSLKDLQGDSFPLIFHCADCSRFFPMLHKMPLFPVWHHCSPEFQKVAGWVLGCPKCIENFKVTPQKKNEFLLEIPLQFSTKSFRWLFMTLVILHHLSIKERAIKALSPVVDLLACYHVSFICVSWKITSQCAFITSSRQGGRRTHAVMPSWENLVANTRSAWLLEKRRKKLQSQPYWIFHCTSKACILISKKHEKKSL